MGDEEDETQIKFPEIAEEIMQRVRVDQEMRKDCAKTGARMDSNIDIDNTRRMKEIVEEIGWPSKGVVGEEAAQGAWLLVQHADYDVDFQEGCLKMMKSLPEDEVSTINIAYLEDRVRCNKGRPQLYGTQFKRPIEDPEYVDERRVNVGLGSLAEYEKDMREVYGNGK